MKPMRWIGPLALAGLACNLLAINASTATPLPTPTIIASAPLASLPPTATETPPPPPAFTLIEALPDGSTRVSDAAMGYALTLPADWLVLDGSDPDVRDLVEGTFKDFPQLQNSLGSFFDQGGLEIRMAALDAADVEEVAAQDAFLTLGFTQDALFTFLDLPSFLALYQQSLPDLFPTAEVLTAVIVQTPPGVEIAVVDLRLPLTDQFGQAVELYQKQVFFKASGGLGVINFSVSAEQRATYEPLFDGMADTLELLD